LLPETDAEGTKGIVARLFQAVDETTFVPETGGKKRIPVPDYVQLRVSAASFERGEEAAEMIDLETVLPGFDAAALPSREEPSQGEPSREGKHA
jgi:hypothetical protein